MKSNTNNILAHIAIAACLLLFSKVNAHTICTKTEYRVKNKGFEHTFNSAPGKEVAGDTWTWRSKVMDTSSTEVGSLIGDCIRVPKGYWNCHESIMLADGHLFAQYVHEPGKASSTGGITGGTHRYMEASGQIDIMEPVEEEQPWELTVELCLPQESKWEL
mmetsp:Transcript_31213/g.67464  ORF Transcript_31213/g.67464 Transcript_31213/m.67464 type:complete len:161 (+) Transcript_31213:92-574(+)